MRLSELAGARDHDAERAVLGAMLLSREAIEQALAVLREEHFTLAGHVAIFRAIRRLWERHEADIDLTTLGSELEAMGKLPDPVARIYLVTLWEAIPSASRLPQYVEPVLRCHMQRLLAAAAGRLVEIAQDGELTCDEMGARADAAVQDAVKQGMGLTRATAIEEAVVDSACYLAERDGAPREVTGVAFGIDALDRRTNGWQAGEVTVIGALPGGGKTAFGCQASMSAAAEGVPVLFFSLEMSVRQIVLRMVANRARIDGLRMERGILDASEQGRRNDAMDWLSNLPVWIDANPEASPAYVLAASRAAEPPPGLVVVDYVGLMSADAKVESENAREVGIMRGLKRTAKILGVPLMVMSQFRKSAAGGQRGRELDDLYGSRSMSAEPGCVVYLHSTVAGKEEEDGEPDFSRPRPVVAVVAKNRHEGTGKVPLFWTPAYVRFDAPAHAWG